MTIPTPDSPEAREGGCPCRVDQNNGGRGVRTKGPTPMFWVDGSCPLHGYAASGEERTPRDWADWG